MQRRFAVPNVGAFDLTQPNEAIYLELKSKKDRLPVAELITEEKRKFLENLTKCGAFVGAVSMNFEMKWPVRPGQQRDLSLVFAVPKKATDSDFLLVFIDAGPQPLVSTDKAKQ